MAVAYGLAGGVVGARHCGRTRRDDDIRWRVVPTLRGGSVDRVTVVSAICCHAGDHAFRLPEQSRRLRCIVGVAVGQRVRGDLAIAGVYGEVELAPSPTCPARLAASHSP